MGEQNPFEQERGRILEALRQVYDPEIPFNIVELGLVRKIEQVEGEIVITMILTVPTCPLAGMIVESVRQAAQAVTDWPVRVELGTEQWDHSMVGQYG